MSNIDNDIQNLTGKILLSTPSVSNEYLNKSMIYLCSHNNNGAMGVVINKLIPNMNICDILKKLKMNPKGVENLDVHFGGLENTDMCFVLHTDEYASCENMLPRDGHVALTVSCDITSILMSIREIDKKLLCMGCCIWEAEQLENEVASSYWIPIASDEALIFGNPRADKWSKALLKIGSQTCMFSSIHGNA